MTETRGTTKSGKTLSEAELDLLNNRLKEKKLRLQEETDTLMEKQKKFSKRMRELESQKEQIERELEERKLNVAAGGTAYPRGYATRNQNVAP